MRLVSAPSLGTIRVSSEIFAELFSHDQYSAARSRLIEQPYWSEHSGGQGQGRDPSPFDPPIGCTFHPRCPIAIDKCRAVPGPELRQIANALT